VPTYAYRCEADGTVDLVLPMAQRNQPRECPSCGGALRRLLTSSRINLGDSRSRRLIDATKRTSDEPAVVGAIPARQPRCRAASIHALRDYRVPELSTQPLSCR
jgi:putative FmdB family regulatory protein